MRMTVAKRHMSVDIQGFLEHYRKRSMRGLSINDDGKPMNDADARQYLYNHLLQGHTVLPMCDDKKCPDFDYFGGGCPGHDVHYYDDDNNEITKEQYESAMKGGGR